MPPPRRRETPRPGTSIRRPRAVNESRRAANQATVAGGRRWAGRPARAGRARPRCAPCACARRTTRSALSSGLRRLVGDARRHLDRLRGRARCRAGTPRRPRATTGAVCTAPRTMRASSTTPPVPEPHRGRHAQDRESRSTRAGAACGTSSPTPSRSGTWISRQDLVRRAWPGSRCRRARRGRAPRSAARPRRTDQRHLRARARSSPARCPTTTAPSRCPTRSHQADVAVLLHAVADGGPPEFGLVVVVAARVDAQVAADGARVAQRRRRDESGGARDRRPALADPRVVARPRSASSSRPGSARRWRRCRAPPAIPRSPTSTFGVNCRRFMFG